MGFWIIRGIIIHQSIHYTLLLCSALLCSASIWRSDRVSRARLSKLRLLLPAYVPTMYKLIIIIVVIVIIIIIIVVIFIIVVILRLLCTKKVFLLTLRFDRFRDSHHTPRIRSDYCRTYFKNFQQSIFYFVFSWLASNVLNVPVNQLNAIPSCNLRRCLFQKHYFHSAC